MAKMANDEISRPGHTPPARPAGGDGGLPALLKRLLRAVGLGRNGPESVRDTLEELIEENLDDAVTIDPHERMLLRNVLGLRDLTALDVMVPRADIVAVEVDVPLGDLARQMIKAAHSRMPVYRGTLDEVVGMVHIKDVLADLHRAADAKLADLVRPVLVVAPSIRALDLLQEMRMTSRHLALVVDEYGGIDGLITIEDLVEEIVGEISDEHDVVEGARLVRRTDGTVVADARATVEEFEAMFGPVLSEGEREDIDTLGGLVFSLAGRILGRGEIIRHPGGIEFEVMEADPRRIRRLRVRPVGDAPDAPGG